MVTPEDRGDRKQSQPVAHPNATLDASCHATDLATCIRRCFAAVSLLILVTPAFSLADDAEPEAPRPEMTSQPCPGAASVVVWGAAAGEGDVVCEGARRAIEFLGKVGLNAPPTMPIEVVETLPGDLGGRAVACYLRTKKILILSYSAFESGGYWFRIPVNRELYRSAAAHEMAHAMVSCHAELSPLPVAAHEYVAYVVMFATMEPTLRKRLLAKFPGKGFSNTLQINDLSHMVSPNQFAVDSWRDYQKRRDRDAWLLEVMAGHVVPELPREGP